jgi:hypothetical protein
VRPPLVYGGHATLASTVVLAELRKLGLLCLKGVPGVDDDFDILVEKVTLLKADAHLNVGAVAVNGQVVQDYPPDASRISSASGFTGLRL